MYEDAMTTLQLDPPPFTRVSLALPAPPAGTSAEPSSKKSVARRPSRFEVVKAPEMLQSVDDQPQEQSPGSDPMTPSSVQSGENEDVCEIWYTRLAGSHNCVIIWPQTRLFYREPTWAADLRSPFSREQIPKHWNLLVRWPLLPWRHIQPSLELKEGKKKDC